MARKPLNRRSAPLAPLKRTRDICLEIQDHSRQTRSAVEFFATKSSAEPQAQAARLADQFIAQNRAYLNRLQVAIRRDYDGSDLVLYIESESAVGAVPLVSPVTARHDYGLVVQPRFPWAGIGPMLAEMGWRVSPTPLKLPLLKRSERRVPPWVLSFMVLARLKALLDRLERRFEITSELRSAPKGHIDWTEYATRHAARGNFLAVPCTFPDLRDDRQLKGAIRFTIEKQLRSLETQREHGSFVHRLIALADSLLTRVQAVPARRPGAKEVETWLHRPIRSEVFIEGLQAIDWTVEERGLAGLSDLEGLPWTMPMDQFFEAWVETVLHAVARRTGGIVKTGRQRQTVAPLSWDPPYLGSQRSLVPDLILELEGLTVIIDAKYKRHWEELQSGGRQALTGELVDEHRHDLHQVLAYANLARSAQVVCCLVYPCSVSTWTSLARRGRLHHRAELPARERRIQLWLTAMPMHAAIDQVAAPLAHSIRTYPFFQSPPARITDVLATSPAAS